MSGGSKSQSQSSQTNTINPQQMALYQGNYANAQANAARLAQPYAGPLTASFTPAQLQSQQLLSGLAANPQFLASIGTAANATQNVLNNPVNGRIASRPVTAAQLSSADLSPYLNPYTSDVINTSLAQLGQQQTQAQMADNQAATAAHAFGGSRSGVANALTNQYYNQQTANLIAGLNQANFSQAQNAALSDIAARNQVGQFNAGQAMNAQNQSFQNALAAQTMGLGAASQLANLANAGLNTASMQAGMLGSVGNQQQQQNQTALTNAYNAYLQNLQQVAAGQNLLNSSLGLIPVQQTVNTNSSNQTSTNPGLVGILGALADVAKAGGFKSVIG